MKNALLGLLLLGVIAAIVGSGTLAYFSDTETSTNNVFAAGTIDLQVDGKDDPNVTTYFSVSDVYPPANGSVVINLTNVGTNAGMADIHIKNVVNGEGSNPVSETDTVQPGDLGKYLNITIVYDGNTIVNDVPINDLNCTNYDMGILNASETKQVTISWNLPAWVGNDVMGDNVTFDIEFSLNQILE